MAIGIPLEEEDARCFSPPAPQGVLPGLLCLRKAEGAKTMPRWAVSEATAEVCAGLRCRWPSRTGARGARRPGREQPEEAAGDETCLTMRGRGVGPRMVHHAGGERFGTEAGRGTRHGVNRRSHARLAV